MKKLIKLLKFSSEASQANKLKFHTQKWLNFCLKLQWNYLISSSLIQQVEFYPEISSLCELTQHDELFTDWVIIWKLLLPLYTFSSAHNDGVWKNNKFLVLFLDWSQFYTFMWDHVMLNLLLRVLILFFYWILSN